MSKGLTAGRKSYKKNGVNRKPRVLTGTGGDSCNEKILLTWTKHACVGSIGLSLSWMKAKRRLQHSRICSIEIVDPPQYTAIWAWPVDSFKTMMCRGLLDYIIPYTATRQPYRAAAADKLNKRIITEAGSLGKNFQL